MPYTPDAVPEDTPPSLKAFIADQLRRIANDLSKPLMLTPIGAEPVRSRDGMIVYADGTNWNPGSGAGVYARVSGAWVKL